MECLIIGINYIFPVKLLKISANGNSSRKNPALFFLYNAFTKESESLKNTQKNGIVETDVDTVGIYRNSAFCLRNSNTAGPANLSFKYGILGDTQLVGDWDGDGVDTIGIYRNSAFT